MGREPDNGSLFHFLWLLASSSQHSVPKLSLQIAVLFQGHISSTLASVLFYLTDSSLSYSGLSAVSWRHWITDQCISPWLAVPTTRDIDWFVAIVRFVQILLTFWVGKWFFFDQIPNMTEVYLWFSTAIWEEGERLVSSPEIQPILWE